MENEPINLEALVKGYQWQVKDVDNALTKLASDVQEFTREADDYEQARDAAQANLNALSSSQETLEQEREYLYREHSRSSFEQNTAKLQAISRRRVELDSELEKVREDVSNVSEVEAVDFSVKAAALELRKQDLKERLPSHKMLAMHLDTLTPFLRSIYDAMQADSTRLHDKHKAIKIPTLYTSKQLENLRLMSGRATNKDPVYLRQQEEKRQTREKELRRNRANANRQAVLDGPPAHTGKSVLVDRMLEETTKV